MCGILAALGLTGDPEKNRRLVLRCSKLQRHRGPDANSIYQSKDGKNFLAFERLQIIDPSDSGRCVSTNSLWPFVLLLYAASCAPRVNGTAIHVCKITDSCYDGLQAALHH